MVRGRTAPYDAASFLRSTWAEETASHLQRHLVMPAKLSLYLAAWTFAAVAAGCLPPGLDSDADLGAGPPKLSPLTHDAGGCYPKITVTDDGHHDPGTACLDCHNGSDPAVPRYTFAGTLFTLKDAKPVAGATIEVTDLKGKQVVITSGTNGNFYTSESLFSPPWNVRVSQCPQDISMPSGALNGDCNSCHRGANKVYLP